MVAHARQYDLPEESGLALVGWRHLGVHAHTRIRHRQVHWQTTGRTVTADIIVWFSIENEII